MAGQPDHPGIQTEIFPAELRALSGPPRAALSNYTVAISKAVAKHNVTINNLLPGMHHTATAQERFGKMAEEQGSSYEQVVQDWIDEWRIPADKFGDIDEFGVMQSTKRHPKNTALT